jgi:hypothetical protein
MFIEMKNIGCNYLYKSLEVTKEVTREKISDLSQVVYFFIA